MFWRPVLATLAAFAATAAFDNSAAVARDGPSPGVLADYYGMTIDLSNGWGSAQACVIEATVATCFNSEAELDTHLTMSAARMSPMFATCGTATRLYADISYGTPVLTVSSRLAWVNLASAGFDNRTRSYRIGSCSAAMAAGSSGSGGFYPGSTAATAQSPSMASGWDRVVSSIYLY